MPKINDGYGKTKASGFESWALKKIGWYDYLNSVTQPYPHDTEAVEKRMKARAAFKRRKHVRIKGQ